MAATVPTQAHSKRRLLRCVAQPSAASWRGGLAVFAPVLVAWNILVLGTWIPLPAAESAALVVGLAAGFTTWRFGWPDFSRHRSFCLAALLGWAITPGLVWSTAAVGHALGLPEPDPFDRAAATPSILLLGLGGAWFEELLYRKHLLVALCERLGVLPAVLVSTAFFALPHIRPWVVAGAGVVGLLLSAVMLRTRNVALCIGVHAGLNVTLLTAPAHPLGPISSLLTGALLFALLARSARQ